MRKIVCIVLCTFFIISLCLGSFASEPVGKMGEVIDELGLITPSDKATVQEFIKKAYNEYSYAIVVVYTRELSDDPSTREAFTEKYFEDRGYGSHGIMLYVGTNSRTYDIYSAHKNHHSLISESELDEIDYYVYESLRNNRFSVAARLFAEQSYTCISTGPSESYYFGGNTLSDILEVVGVSFILALIISLIVVFVMKSKMKGIKLQRGAHGYIDRSSVRIYERQDRFLYSTIRKIRRDTDSHSGGGGGRSSSRSSGGSHRGGRF